MVVEHGQLLINLDVPWSGLPSGDSEPNSFQKSIYFHMPEKESHGVSGFKGSLYGHQTHLSFMDMQTYKRLFSTSQELI